MILGLGPSFVLFHCFAIIASPGPRPSFLYFYYSLHFFIGQAKRSYRESTLKASTPAPVGPADWLEAIEHAPFLIAEDSLVDIIMSDVSENVVSNKGKPQVENYVYGMDVGLN